MDNSTSLQNILSLLNIIATVILGCWGYNLNKKINSININTVFYNELFNKILLEELPVAVDEAIKNNFQNFEKLDDVLVNLQKKSLYLKYKNNNFYSELSDQILKIDDFLGRIYNTQLKDGTDKKFEAEIKKLYEIIYKNYNY